MHSKRTVDMESRSPPRPNVRLVTRGPGSPPEHEPPRDDIRHIRHRGADGSEREIEYGDGFTPWRSLLAIVTALLIGAGIGFALGAMFVAAMLAAR